MAIEFTARLTYPPAIRSDVDRYRHAHSALEALRLRHNTRAGDLRPAAIGFRLLCWDASRLLIEDILSLRPRVRTIGWEPRDVGDFDPRLLRLKGEGRSDHGAADLRELTGIDLDVVTLSELPPDPTEDLTTFSETDPNNRLSWTASTLTYTGLQRDEDCWGYKDYGADHFGATFLHYFDVKGTTSDADYALMAPWVLTNVLEELKYLEDNGSQAVNFQSHASTGASGNRFLLQDMETADSDFTANGFWVVNTTYYITCERTGETTLVARVYSDAIRTALLDTLAVTMTSGRRFRYAEMGVSYNDAETNDISGTVANLDLNEVTYVPYPFSRGARGGLHALTGGLN